MILRNSFNDQKSHRPDVGAMVRDELQVEVFILHGHNLRQNSLQLVELDLSVEAAQLPASTEADDERLERGYELRAGDEHKHQVVESGAQQQPKLAREVHDLIKEIFVERDKGCVHLLRQTLLVSAQEIRSECKLYKLLDGVEARHGTHLLQ